MRAAEEGEPLLRDWLRANRQALDAVVLDIDGVLTRHGQALPGAAELLAYLEATGFPYTLLTNDSCHSPEEKVEYLGGAGLSVAVERVCSAGHAIRELVAARRLEGELFCALGRLGQPDYAERAGLRVTRDPWALLRGPACRGIIVGEKEYEWEPALNAAVNYLIANPEGLLICPNPDLYFPIGPAGPTASARPTGALGSAPGIRLSSGAVALFMREVVRSYGRPCAPIYLGKPHRPVFELNHAALEGFAGAALPRNRVLMVGDSLSGDVAGARAFGYRAGLALTGLTTPELLEAAKPKPDLVIRGL